MPKFLKFFDTIKGDTEKVLGKNNFSSHCNCHFFSIRLHGRRNCLFSQAKGLAYVFVELAESYKVSTIAFPVSHSPHSTLPMFKLHKRAHTLRALWWHHTAICSGILSPFSADRR